MYLEKNYDRKAMVEMEANPNGYKTEAGADYADKYDAPEYPLPFPSRNFLFQISGLLSHLSWLHRLLHKHLECQAHKSY